MRVQETKEPEFRRQKSREEREAQGEVSVIICRLLVVYLENVSQQQLFKNLSLKYIYTNNTNSDT